MNILITGGCGFLGARLARTLLAQGSLAVAGQPARAIESITLADRAPPADDLAADKRVRFAGGDLNAQVSSGALPAAGTHVVFHLAAAVSGECEADFELGMNSNLDATRALLDACRRLGTQPTFVFASSLAVFGNLPAQPLPELIEDFTLTTPQSSYGIQKFIGEQLVADYARKGFVRGRSVRLMTVSVRPGKPNGAASSFLSGMIREPLAGVKAAVPVPAETPVALSSPARTIEGVIRAAQATDAQWGPLTAVNLPARWPARWSVSRARRASHCWTGRRTRRSCGWSGPGRATWRRPARTPSACKPMVISNPSCVNTSGRIPVR
jgi:nucleoside-diphosphate-sugar epimerase